MTGCRIAIAITVALTAGLLAGPALVRAETSALSSDEKLRQIMEQARPQSTGEQAGGSAVDPAAAVAKAAISPDRLQERARLLRTGEAALARLDVAGALQAFDRAALIAHAADTEIALVRTYMQGGQYRRALAFGAHTAGAHLDVMGGSAAYVWLLHAGGQGAVAQRLLDEAHARMPDSRTLATVQKALNSGSPVASGVLLAPPVRLAPYGSSAGLPAKARVTSTGVLLPGGTHAVVPASRRMRVGSIWLRNALGQLVAAKIEKSSATDGVLLLKLARPLPTPETYLLAPHDAFPGSAAFAVEQRSAHNAAPAWPQLHSGFLGAVLPGSNPRPLGISLPRGPRGGPVFDAGGRLTGIALPNTAGSGDLLLPVSQLQNSVIRTAAATALGIPAAASGDAIKPVALTRMSVDQIYENSLTIALQVITAP